MNFINISKRLILLTFFLLSTFLLHAQNSVIRGIVTDANDKDPLQSVTVSFPGTTVGVSTDEDGMYMLNNTGNNAQIKFTYVGYKDLILNIVPGKDTIINVKLSPTATQLAVATVTGNRARTRYRNRDNPAVELIRKVVENKEKNQPENYNYVEYQEYDKLVLSAKNLSPTLSDKKLLRKFKFLLDNRDTTTVPGASLLPWYLVEKISQYYYRKNPEKERTVIVAKDGVDFGSAIDNDGIEQYLTNLYTKVDIYKNDIFIFTRTLSSPISDNAPLLYKFFITDTTVVNNVKVVELSFTPRNTQDLLFEGKIWVTLDGNYAVQRAKLYLNKDINLNFVKSMIIEQDFEKNPDGRYHISRNNVMADFGFSKKKETGIYGKRTVIYSNYLVNQPRLDTAYMVRADEVELSDEVKNRGEEYWAKNRPESLTLAESKVYTNIDSLQNMQAYKNIVDVGTLLLAGYKSFGKFEVGPANTFYSFNPIEGLKLRLGGRTTPQLSKRYYFETYAAYGFNDKQWKYFLSGTYSFNNSSIYRFPQHYLRASFQRDTKIPGLNLQFVQQDNFFLSFKRGSNDKYLYNDQYRLDYVHEFENRFSYSLGFRHLKQAPAGSLYFNNVFGSTPNITTTELGFNLRYAPGEMYYQGPLYRKPIKGPYPVMSFDYVAGLKNVFGGDYAYHNLHLRFDKRFYLSQLGLSDVIVEGGYIFGKVPYPLLNIFAANQTFAYNLYSYNLMNFLEFVADRYVTLNVDHHFMGFFFNKIPLFKKLKLREVVSFKGAYGSVSDTNNPYLQPTLFQFPVTTDGRPITYALGNTPYIEGSVGIENIFKALRIDLVRRFNYLDHPEVAKWGIRARLKVEF
ncbi:MAG: carboxypeptidase-like regulatory domain-containing protein [Sphingobacteriaceae bacterium]|nr:MAG: carboxypeptidase-like regulatory domain-containing protein [Sphingobacteriaceae bacterium]